MGIRGQMFDRAQRLTELTFLTQDPRSKPPILFCPRNAPASARREHKKKTMLTRSSAAAPTAAYAAAAAVAAAASVAPAVSRGAEAKEARGSWYF